VEGKICKRLAELQYTPTIFIDEISEDEGPQLVRIEF